PGRPPPGRPERLTGVPEQIDIFVPLDEDEDDGLGARAERALGWARGAVLSARVVRRSLDARKGRPLGHRLRVEVARAGEAPLGAATGAPDVSNDGARWPAGRTPPRVVIIGAGPA